MFSFQKKEIIPATTLGEKIKKQRIDKGLDIETVSEKLQIAEKYLKAIEESDFDKLPEGVYIEKFLQSYCHFLDLDFSEIIKDYQNDKNTHQTIKKTNIKIFNKEKEKLARCWYSFITFNLLKNLILFLLVFTVLAFLGFKINNIVAPPKLIISKPANNLVIKDNYTEIAGQTDVGADVSINGQTVMVNSDGSFIERLNLQSGLNIITISSEKKYSKEAVVDRKIMVER